MSGPQILIVGGGMITHDQLLPSLYHIQRQGRLGPIAVCASRFGTVRDLARGETLLRAFPGQSFRAWPDRDGPPQPELYREAIAALPPRQIVVVAVPDQLHYGVAMAALARDQHVLCVKPLVLEYRHAAAIEREARARALLVAVERRLESCGVDAGQRNVGAEPVNQERAQGEPDPLLQLVGLGQRAEIEVCRKLFRC